MHGVVFTELREYVESQYGAETWNNLLAEAKLGRKIYLPVHTYPDSEAFALVIAASQLTGKSASAILEDFGEYIATPLLQMYWALIQPSWRTLDVIEHTEQVIHKVVRLQNAGATPPELSCTRTQPDEITLVYASPRKMCSLAKGIAQGMAKYYGEKIAIRDTSCMHKGDPNCTITISLIQPAA